MIASVRGAGLAGVLLLCAAQLSRADVAQSCPADMLSPQPYFQAATLDLIGLVAPPPAAGSAAARRDLQAVIAAQRAARRQGSTAHAVDDSQPNCLRFADVLGSNFSAARAPLAVYFLTRAALAGASVSGPGKSYWWRPRPYLLSSRVQRLADVAPDALEGRGPFDDFRSACHPGETPRAPRRIADLDPLRSRTSFPSGHAAFGATCAILLAAMVPEQRAALFARGRDFGQSRVVVGAHFPTDVEAGRILATVAVAQMQQGAAFRQDFERARLELRAALGLPPDPPNVAPPAPVLHTPATPQPMAPGPAPSASN
jgi:acid phosphatase (class A)